jgi:hypothetical protein
MSRGFLLLFPLSSFYDLALRSFCLSLAIHIYFLIKCMLAIAGIYVMRRVMVTIRIKTLKFGFIQTPIKTRKRRLLISC